MINFQLSKNIKITESAVMKRLKEEEKSWNLVEKTDMKLDEMLNNVSQHIPSVDESLK